MELLQAISFRTKSDKTELTNSQVIEGNSNQRLVLVNVDGQPIL